MDLHGRLPSEKLGRLIDDIEAILTDQYEMVQAAFARTEHTNHDEQNLVARLRKSVAFVPELSLVTGDCRPHPVHSGGDPARGA